MRNISESVLARLKNESKKKGVSLQQLLNSLESTVVEKVDAIMTLMETTGRMKDFYDIYYIATTFNFEGRKLLEAI